MPKTIMSLAGVVFLLVSSVHLARLIFKFEMTIAGKTVPLWVNAVGFVITLALSIWLFVAQKKIPPS